jgi:hypothetical protein
VTQLLESLANGALIRRHVVTLVVLVACLFAVALFFRFSHAGQRSALQALPPAERAALYARTLANLRDVCAPSRPSGLDAFCDEQAELALDFDECDADCSKLALAHHGVPTR